MADSDRKQSMIVQAGILAAAGIVVRIIGLLYNTPLVHIIGDEGFGYYDSAYAAYSIILLISSYSIPSAISKIIAQKLAHGQYKNAFRIFKMTLAYVIVVGLIAALFVFFGAGLLVKMDSAILPLKILAPTIFFSGILGAFRGFFQAQRSMVQTSLSQILEQIFNAIFSVWMAYILVGSATAKGLSQSGIASYGAAGSTIGTGVGVLSALIFMLFLYFYNRKTVLAKVASDEGPAESYWTILKNIFLVVTPFILSTGIYNINSFMDKTIYQVVLMKAKDVVEADVAFDLSAYAKANKIANIPIAMSAAMASTMIPRLSGYIAKKQEDIARNQVERAIKITMFISIPSAVGLGVLSKPIMRVMFNQKASLNLSSSMLTVLAITVVLYGLSTLTQAVLQSMGHMNLPIINALIAVVVHAGLMVLFMLILPRGAMLYCYGAATILYALILCILNGMAVKKYLHYEQEIDRTFLRPAISSAAMGLIVLGVYEPLYLTIGSNMLALFVSVVIGIMLYFFLCIKWQAITEDELKALPKGHMIVKICRRTKLLK